MTFGQSLFDPREGETPEETAARQEKTVSLLRRVFNTPDGRRALGLLCNACHPMEPRFLSGITPEQAAFRDGQRDVLGVLWLNGTTLKTFEETDSFED